MRKIISLLLIFSLATSLLVPVYAQAQLQPSNISVESSIDEFESAFPTNYPYSTTYSDMYDNEVNILFSIAGSGVFVEVYVNGILSQRTYSSEKEDIILFLDYSNCSREIGEKALEVISYSDVVQDVVYDDKSETCNEVNLCASVFDPEGWSYLMTRPSNLMITGSKPCAIYVRNYDEEPDLHRYSGKKIQSDAGTAIGIIVSVVAAFITGGVSVGQIVVALGSAIVADIITKAISGEVCFSTQKIRYAPVINGLNIFPDAYVTKRWVIISDTVNRTESYELDEPEYDYNRGHDAYAIATNAQQAEVDMSH